MAATSFVFTARYVAEHLGVDEASIDEMAIDMEPEDGCLSVIDSAEENAPAVTAFTRRGIEYLREIIDARSRDPASN